MKTKINNLGNQLEDILNDYVDDISDITKEEIDTTTRNTKKVIKSHAPESKGKRKGTYKKSIKSQTVSENLTSKVNVIYVKKPEYRLPHLLENGHALVKGGRTRAIPHWKYGQEYAEKELPERIKKRIGGLNNGRK